MVFFLLLLLLLLLLFYCHYYYYLQLRKYGVLKPEDIQTMFMNTDELHRASRHMLALLEQARQTNDLSVNSKANVLCCSVSPCVYVVFLFFSSPSPSLSLSLSLSLSPPPLLRIHCFRVARIAVIASVFSPELLGLYQVYCEGHPRAEKAVTKSVIERKKRKETMWPHCDNPLVFFNFFSKNKPKDVCTSTSGSERF